MTSFVKQNVERVPASAIGHSNLSSSPNLERLVTAFATAISSVGGVMGHATEVFVLEYCWKRIIIYEAHWCTRGTLSTSPSWSQAEMK